MPDRFLALGIAAALALACTQAQAAGGVPMTVPCQRNLDDGRVLLSDDPLPPNPRYTVLHYAPSTSSEGWSHGQCEILVTEGAPG